MVKSYLSWLQDSDFNTNCSLCAQPFSNENTINSAINSPSVHSAGTLNDAVRSEDQQPLLENTDTIRLECLCVFHYSCFINKMRQLPTTTAPSEYKCPSCSARVISNSNSLLNTRLKQLLHSESWYQPVFKTINPLKVNSNPEPIKTRVEIQESSLFPSIFKLIQIRAGVGIGTVC